MITKRVQDLEYLASERLDTPHGFSTRLGGVSEGHLASLNLGCHRGDRDENLRENYRRFCAAIGADVGSIVMTRQVHRTEVRAVTRADIKADVLDEVPFEADGLTTDIPGIALFVFSADCIPVLLFDPVKKAIGACHAGWRGTAGAIAGETVKAMVSRYGCKAEDIRAAIGPGIGKCCFETDADVPEAMLASLGDLARPHITRTGEKWHVDLKAVNRAVLLDAGVRPEHIDVSEDCTCCQHDRFWSHRYTGGLRGSQAACVMLEGRV